MVLLDPTNQGWSELIELGQTKQGVRYLEEDDRS